MEAIAEWAKTCLNKNNMSEAHADIVIRRAALTGTKLRKYSCPHCFSWHVTSQINNKP